MAKLGAEMQQIMKDKAAMLDPNMKQHDSDDEEISSDEENFKGSSITFISAIDVGSHFIDIKPDGELTFNQFEGSLIAQFNISNPCANCQIAYFVYTSAAIPVRIVPNCGFIPASFSQPIKIAWERDQMPDKRRLENSMFFVKALPLSPQMDIEDLSTKLE